ncbi:hypothetical protein [Gemmobacter aquatilis]|uniref:hypothetical protein n=1 Tax=Gemmobacter aquatilis TaxID=933059 RepID=UPI0015873603|nr:hypothetical protein [Gemmobacter aquatilis]
MVIITRDGSVKGTLCLYKRVPRHYASVEQRKFVWISPAIIPKSRLQNLDASISVPPW